MWELLLRLATVTPTEDIAVQVGTVAVGTGRTVQDTVAAQGTVVGQDIVVVQDIVVQGTVVAQDIAGQG